RQFPFAPAEHPGVLGADARIEDPLRVSRTAGVVRVAFGERAPIGRIGEPDAAVRMRHDIVRGVQRLAVIGIGDHGHCAVMLPANDAAVEMLARELAPQKIEGIAVAVVGGTGEYRHPTVIPDVAVLYIPGDIAEDDVMALVGPRRPLGPQRAGPYPVNRALV